MKINEIENKYFYAHSGGAFILETYKNPEDELLIDFKIAAKEHGKIFCYATVTEKISGEKVVQITFSLSKNTQSLDIGTVEPFDNEINNKIYHSSLGTHFGSSEMGYTAIKWVFKKIKEFSLTQGYNIKHISSTTRSTGARAKNNPGDDGTGMPKNFNVSRTLKESIVYNCVTNELTINQASV